GQVCPNHYHKLIKETFIVIRGDITLSIDGERHVLSAGETITLPPGTWHEFTSSAGAVVEEVTTRQHPDDSCFADETIRRYVSEDEG
ncbi:MAG: cupin domain-containing protein, partial [Spirochaetales bacterium]|nr:cupin domain-containing protein [Spirochaetales bacterium]